MALLSNPISFVFVHCPPYFIPKSGELVVIHSIIVVSVATLLSLHWLRTITNILPYFNSHSVA